ncbi:MAG: insulinase family protein, partial [Gammaproteobacteria bacterium]|nr:insulinase family protein [Gammaproteobacteria bacterium]
YYRPENVTLLVVGDVEAAPTMDLVREYFADWEPGYVAPQIPAEPEQTEEKRVDVSYPGRALPILALAYKFDA